MFSAYDNILSRFGSRGEGFGSCRCSSSFERYQQLLVDAYEIISTSLKNFEFGVEKIIYAWKNDVAEAGE